MRHECGFALSCCDTWHGVPDIRTQWMEPSRSERDGVAPGAGLMGQFPGSRFDLIFLLIAATPNPSAAPTATLITMLNGKYQP